MSKPNPVEAMRAVVRAKAAESRRFQKVRGKAGSAGYRLRPSDDAKGWHIDGHGVPGAHVFSLAELERIFEK